MIVLFESVNTMLEFLANFAATIGGFSITKRMKGMANLIYPLYDSFQFPGVVPITNTAIRSSITQNVMSAITL